VESRPENTWAGASHLRVNSREEPVQGQLPEGIAQHVSFPRAAMTIQVYTWARHPE